MNWGDIIRRSGRAIRQAKIRTLLTAAALAVGGFTLTATLAAANGARAYGNKLIDTNFDPSSLIVAKNKNVFGGGGTTNKPQPYSSSFTNVGGKTINMLDQQDLNKLASFPGVQSVFEPYTTSVQYITGPNGSKYTGSVEAFNPNISHQYAAGGVTGNIPEGKVVVPADYLSLLGYKNAQSAIGQNINIQVRQILGGQADKSYTIMAILTPPSTLIGGNVNSTLFLNANDARSIYDYVNKGTINYNRFLTAIVRVKDGTNQAKLNAVQNEIKNAGYGAESAKNAQAVINQIVNVLQIIIVVFGLITLVASFFGIVNTQYISVLERTREIGLMKALGMSSKNVSKLFIVEAAWIGGIGAVLGSIVAIIIGVLINPWISNKINFSNSRLLLFRPSQVIGLIIFLIIIAVIAGLLPARKAAKLDPIEALRTE